MQPWGTLGPHQGTEAHQDRHGDGMQKLMYDDARGGNCPRDPYSPPPVWNAVGVQHPTSDCPAPPSHTGALSANHHGHLAQPHSLGVSSTTVPTRVCAPPGRGSTPKLISPDAIKHSPHLCPFRARGPRGAPSTWLRCGCFRMRGGRKRKRLGGNAGSSPGRARRGVTEGTN